MKDFPKRGPRKFKIFNLLRWTHEILKATKNKRKTKFETILDTKMGVSLKRGNLNSMFLTTHATHMKFSG